MIEGLSKAKAKFISSRKSREKKGKTSEGQNVQNFSFREIFVLDRDRTHDIAIGRQGLARLAECGFFRWEWI